MELKPNFSGYVTRYGLKCSDGRIIKHNAFKDFHNKRLPLVWRHLDDSPDKVLGHVDLEHRDDGVYAHAFFNGTKSGQDAKELVEHGDVSSLSIYANRLVQNGSEVVHGNLKEVSLVLAGANPGAYIDNVNIQHADGFVDLESEAIISHGIKIDLDVDSEEDDLEHEEAKTVQEIYESLSQEQKEAVTALVGEAVKRVTEEAKQEDSDEQENLDESDDDHLNHSEEGNTMARNVFEQNGKSEDSSPVLTHEQIDTIFKDAARVGSLKESFLAHAANYGIQNIDVLFPDAKSVTPTPEFFKRDTGWVSEVMGGVRKTPFSRIKSTSADITHDEARARGYIKGNLKKDEFFKVSKRTTTPTTVYKKQKLDRDDIIDITDFDVVAWLRAEMRMMLDEEIARSILIGDGRSMDDEDKINEENLRPIAKDDHFFAHQVEVNSNISAKDFIKVALRSRRHYKGVGNPTLFTTESMLSDLLLIEDKVGRRLYETEASLAAALRVSKIVPVEVMETDPTLIGILVNISDYTTGADKGGQITLFDDFDIDYNQQKYLIETRLSGALTKPKSAVVIRRSEGTEVTPLTPTVSEDESEVTIPNVAGVKYYNEDTQEVLTGKVPVNGVLVIHAEPEEGYYFSPNAETSWTFTHYTM